MIRAPRLNRLLALLVAAVLLSLAVAGGVFLLARSIFTGRIERMVEAEDYQESRVENTRQSLQQFIADKGLGLQDVFELSQWEASHPYVILNLYAARQMIYATGFSQEDLQAAPPEAYLESDQGYLNALPLLDFAGAQARAFIYVYDEVVYYNMAYIAAILLAGLCFTVLLFLLIHHKLRYITLLKAQTAILEGGDLSFPITVRGRDDWLTWPGRLMRCASPSSASSRRKTRRARQTPSWSPPCPMTCAPR